MSDNKLIRLSREEDKDAIRSLIQLCFGLRDHCDVTDNLKGRYLLCFLDGKLVAMTGIYLLTDLTTDGVEIDWTCTHPDYRHSGLMQELFRRITQLTDEDIYCSCWRLFGAETINLKSIMDMYDFKCVHHAFKCHDSNNGCMSKDSCTGRKDDCICFEDLYIRHIGV